MLRFTVILAFILTTTGCGIINSIKLRNSNDHLKPLWPTGIQTVGIETHYLGEKPYIDVTLNGVDGFKFLVDTGASVTIVMDTPKINALGLTRGYDLAMAGWGEEEKSPAYQTQVDTLSLSGIGFTNVNLAFLPTSTTKYFLDPSEAIYDGVIGHDIMHHFSWLFDKKANRIAISQTPHTPSDEAIEIPFDTFFSKIDIEGKIDFGNGQTISHKIIIDTGSRHYLKVASALIDNEGIVLPGKPITAADFGLSGRDVHQRVTLPSLSLGELKLTNIKTNLIGGDFEDDFSVIGSALLNQFVSVIDYHREKLYLIPYSDQPFKTKYNLLGLELRKLVSGNFIVRFVFPDMVTAHQDFQEGDLITSINGKPSQQISLADWLNLSASPDTYTICRLRQQELCVTLTSGQIEGYSIPVSSAKPTISSTPSL
ncbi:aspartyl protease family protein [Aliikangiella marina]|uniref:aspartyl protease family protein n=1 Tax=Aliikangiella marina TaxID=1712262 RepID=UPI00163D5BFE|nr:aspartyl protease family protein [Aliikangiella marina]